MYAIRLSLATFILIFVLAVGDIIYDWQEAGNFDAHILGEIIMGLVSLIAFAALSVSIWLNNRKLKETHQQLNQANNDLTTSEHQTQKLMGDFSKIIQAQFASWQLTESEKEVALLLLKGLSLDEIAAVRETKAKTVRQQASNLYKKAGISGRHELVAFFFEELLIK
jgi:DNA-binding CsgD family transcriptional regulator